MTKNILFISAFSIFTAILFVQICHAKEKSWNHCLESGGTYTRTTVLTDTVPPADVMDIVTTVVYSLNTFHIEKDADLYTPNSVILENEPPYSWNGPTAGIQWVNAVERVCKENRLTKLKGSIETINVFQQSADNFYIVVPVSFTGDMPGKQS